QATSSREPSLSKSEGASLVAWAAGGIWSRSSTGIGGAGGIPPFYGRWGPEQVQPVNGYLLIGSLQWRGDVEPSLEEQRHVGQCVAHRDRLVIGNRWRPRVVGRAGQGLLGRQFEVLLLDLVPDGLVNALRIALAGRETVLSAPVTPWQVLPP